MLLSLHLTNEIAVSFISNQLEGFTWNRLYRLEIQKLETPAASASRAASWRMFALVYDVCAQTPEQLRCEVLRLLDGEAGEFRIHVLYWDGDMVTPQTVRLMGKGENFLYNTNPRGSVILRSENPIEFEI